MLCIFFFFSSRRRHTRFDCDWSSDVCSSDLLTIVRDRRDRLDVEHVARGVTDRLAVEGLGVLADGRLPRDRKSTRLNSSHSQISYAVFCLKKKISARHDATTQ